MNGQIYGPIGKKAMIQTLFSVEIILIATNGFEKNQCPCGKH
jgi:hypothetical protein